MLRRLTTLRDEGGYAMVAVLAVMLIASLAAVAAVNATDGDIAQGADDKDRKAAYAAAEAGVNDYLAHLVADVDYWRKCEDNGRQGMNLRWNGQGADPRSWRPMGDSTARYAIEVLPANGEAQCEAGARAADTFIDKQTATFRIRSTGEARPGGRKRSIVATFRRRGFLDFVYFTDYETYPSDLMVTDDDIQGLPTRVSNQNPQTIVEWARLNCEKYYRDGRGQATNVYSGEEQTGPNKWEPIKNVYGQRTSVACAEIQFKSDTATTGIDFQKGPFHTNDEILVCRNPVFGESPADDIEVSAPAPAGGAGGSYGSPAGWRANCTGSKPVVNDPGATPINNSVGTWRKSAPLMTLPPSNKDVAEEALPAYRFVGRTTIVMSGDKMTVTGKRTSGQVLTGVTMDLPTDGVISIADDGVCGGLDPLKPLSSPATCGDLWLSGTYTKNVTMTASNDILIRGNVTKPDTSDAMLGLIASKWVRVHHPTSKPEGYDCGTNQSSPTDMKIHAAILAVNKSFTVDKYWCGANLGTLSVRGAIAQQFRGPVGRGSSGYTKDYVYDRRLRFRSPPRFLDPVEASWRVQSQVEQVPAT